jgi:hypothetical protein
MTISKKFGFLLLVGMIGLAGLEAGEQWSTSGVFSFTPTVEARVGRPLTPVSVAGVGRRTVRRCAAGVYDC